MGAHRRLLSRGLGVRQRPPRSQRSNLLKVLKFVKFRGKTSPTKREYWKQLKASEKAESGAYRKAHEGRGA